MALYFGEEEAYKPAHTSCPCVV